MRRALWSRALFLLSTDSAQAVKPVARLVVRPAQDALAGGLRLQLVDELYSSLYTPLMLARVPRP